MAQYKIAIYTTVIVMIVFFSGCTGGQDITPTLKELPEFQQFLKEHPNAKITLTYWSMEEVEKKAQEISQQCDKPIMPVAMYRAIVSDGDLKIVSWINEENKKVICSMTESKDLQTNKSASTSNTTPTYTKTLTATPILTPTATPTSIVTPTISPIPIPIADQKTFTNSIDMEFVLIPSGEFDMGSPSNEAGRSDNEGPVHRVKITKAFYMGKYEVTQRQWREVMGNNPSSSEGDKLPVEQVSWNDVQEFIKKLNEKDGTNKYRLPSEAEWEYAARAGTTTRYFFGDDESKRGDYAWYFDNSDRSTHGVGQKKPNPWGLYDMYGNVWEWVQDTYHDSYNDAPADGSAWEDYGSNRVARGHGFLYDETRSAARDGDKPSFRTSHVGFRLLRDL